MNIENHKKIIDDSILWSPNLKQAFINTSKFLTLVGQNGVVLNKKKFKFAREQTGFARFKVGKGKIKPLDEHVEADQEFPDTRNTLGSAIIFCAGRAGVLCIPHQGAAQHVQGAAEERYQVFLG